MKRSVICLAAALVAGPALAAEMSDADVLGVLAAINRNELDAANEAVKKNASNEVLNYAKMMQEDHGANLEQTQKLARRVGDGPSESATSLRLRAKGAAQLASLTPMNNAKFDAAYMKTMVAGHAEALTLIDEELLPAAKSQEVKDHLQKTREKVAQHLREAKDIQARLAR